MATFNPAKDIPSDFYTAKTFFTLSGAAASVWIFCIVMGAIFPTNCITPFQYRIMAISLSEIISLFMVFRLKNRKPENWFLAVFNGILIFINASGWNVITTNNFFSDKPKKDDPKASVYLFQSPNRNLAGLSIFKKQIYWWQDNSVFIENRAVKKENAELKKELTRMRTVILHDTLRQAPPGDKQLSQLIDSLQFELRDRDVQIQELKKVISVNRRINDAPSRNTVVITDTLRDDERKKLLYSMRAQKDNYEIKLSICESEKRELQSKLNILNHAFKKESGLGN